MVMLLPGRLEVAATVAYEVAHVLSPMMQSRSSGRQLLYGRTAGFRNPRARIMSARVCVMRWGSRWSGNSRANRSANTLLGHRQKHDAAVGINAPAVEGGDDFLGVDGWKREQLEAIVWSWRTGRSLAGGVIG